MEVNMKLKDQASQDPLKIHNKFPQKRQPSNKNLQSQNNNYQNQYSSNSNTNQQSLRNDNSKTKINNNEGNSINPQQISGGLESISIIGNSLLSQEKGLMDKNVIIVNQKDGNSQKYSALVLSNFNSQQHQQNPQTSIMNKRPKLNENIKLIERAIKRQNQTQQEQRGHSIPLINQFESQSEKKSLERKQIGPNHKSPLLSYGGKSRNFDQSNSASKIYSSTLKGGTQLIRGLNSSPYLNNGMAIYTTHQEMSGTNDNYNHQHTNSIFSMNSGKNMPIQNLDKKLVELDFEGPDHKLTDLSFESLNPINNSFTAGLISDQDPSPFSGQNKFNGNQSTFIKQHPQTIKMKPQLNKLPKQPVSYDRLSEQLSGQKDNQMFNLDEGHNFQKQNVNIMQFLEQQKKGELKEQSWWQQQQMFQQPLANDILESQSLYQLQNVNPIINSPFVLKQPVVYSKSRDGQIGMGYRRNIPSKIQGLNDMNSKNDQSPAKQEDIENHPFKGPKLHLFKKGASRRIQTSSATRNLQPIYPLDILNNHVFQNNFNSINTQGLSSQAPIILQNQANNSDQENLSYNPYVIQNQSFNSLQPGGHSQSAQKKLSANNLNSSPFGNILIGNATTATNTTIDVYSNSTPSKIYPIAHNNGTYSNLSYDSRSIPTHQQKSKHSNTKTLENQTSPKKSKASDIPKQQQQPSDCYNLTNINKQKLQDEINGFKHSFYNPKGGNSSQRENHQESKTSIQSIIQIDQVDDSNQDNATQQDPQSQAQIKHIFVLNVKNNQNQSNNLNMPSTQESKAMTPCFLLTPNMTNKWGNFKPEDPIQEEQEYLSQNNNTQENYLELENLQNKPQTSHFGPKTISKSSKQININSNNQSFSSIQQQDSLINLIPSDIKLNKNISAGDRTNKSEKSQINNVQGKKLPISRNQIQQYQTEIKIQKINNQKNNL